MEFTKFSLFCRDPDKTSGKGFKKLASLLVVVIFLCNTILPSAIFIRSNSIEIRGNSCLAAEVFGSPHGPQLRREASQALGLPSPTQFVNLSQAYSFPVLKGLKFDPNKPLIMEFLIDTGNQGKVDKEEVSRLIRYFLAGLTIPAENLWVNLSPYEKNRILPDVLTSTELGDGLLSQDYILKQISASLTYPESSSGKDFWGKTYQEVLKVAKTTNIPVSTFNKIWIVPDKVAVYEHDNLVVVSEASLKAMLEEDYLALEKSNQQSIVHSPQKDQINKVASCVMKDIILPKINEDINKGKNFATLRQICHSLILAGWFKKKFKDSLYKHYIDQAKLKGIDVSDKQAREKVYNLYLEAFQKGLYNYIKPEKELATKKNIKRKYYSGGINTSLLTATSPMITSSSIETITGSLFSNISTIMQVYARMNPTGITAGTLITEESKIATDPQINGPTIGKTGLKEMSRKELRAVFSLADKLVENYQLTSKKNIALYIRIILEEWLEEINKNGWLDDKDENKENIIAWGTLFASNLFYWATTKKTIVNLAYEFLMKAKEQRQKKIIKEPRTLDTSIIYRNVSVDIFFNTNKFQPGDIIISKKNNPAGKDDFPSAYKDILLANQYSIIEITENGSEELTTFSSGKHFLTEPFSGKIEERIIKEMGEGETAVFRKSSSTITLEDIKNFFASLTWKDYDERKYNIFIDIDDGNEIQSMSLVPSCQTNPATKHMEFTYNIQVPKKTGYQDLLQFILTQIKTIKICYFPLEIKTHFEKMLTSPNLGLPAMDNISNTKLTTLPVTSPSITSVEKIVEEITKEFKEMERGELSGSQKIAIKDYLGGRIVLSEAIKLLIENKSNLQINRKIAITVLVAAKLTIEFGLMEKTRNEIEIYLSNIPIHIPMAKIERDSFIKNIVAAENSNITMEIAEEILTEAEKIVTEQTEGGINLKRLDVPALPVSSPINSTYFDNLIKGCTGLTFTFEMRELKRDELK